MSRGLAIIATDVGAINILVSKNNGWLLKECSPELIGEAMQKALTASDKDMLVKKEKSFSFTQEKLLWEKVAEKLIGELQRITRRLL